MQTPHRGRSLYWCNNVISGPITKGFLTYGMNIFFILIAACSRVFFSEFWTVSHLPVNYRKENFRILTLNTVTEPCNLGHVFCISFCLASWADLAVKYSKWFQGSSEDLVRSSWFCVLECKTLKLKERTLSFYHCHCPNTYESFCIRPGLLSGLNGYKTIKDRNCKLCLYFYGHFFMHFEFLIFV